MKKNKQWLKAAFSAFVIWTFLIGGVPVKAQDIVTSDDISGGSSVFVFRQGRKSAQVKAAFRRGGGGSLRSQQSGQAREKIREQAIFASAQRKRAPKIDPNSVAMNRQSKGVGNRTRTNNGNKNVGAPVTAGSAKKESNALAGVGESFLDQKQFDEAILAFRQALEKNPKNESAKLGLSEAYTRKGDDLLDKSNADAAIVNYRQAISSNSQNAAAYAGIAQAYEDINASDKAIENYEKALALNPKLTEIYAPLGRLYFEKNEIAQADNYLGKAIAANPNDTSLQFYIGVVCYKQNQNEQAVAALKQAVAANANSAEGHYYLGAAYDRLDRENEALAEYNQAVKINPNYLEAWFDMGVMNYNRGHYEEAVKDYKEALRIKNDYGQAHANLADTYRQMAIDTKAVDEATQNKKHQLFEQANGEYTLAAVFIKDDAELYSNWAFCLGRVEKWDNAIAQLNTAVSIKPAAADYSNIGWAYLNAALLDKQNNREDAAKTKLETGKAALQKAVEMNPKLSGAFVNLGMTFTELGEFQSAVNALQTALNLRGDWWVLDHELGYAYRQLNDLASAVKFFKKTTELKSDYADGWYNLGEAQYRLGNKKEAKEAFEHLKKLDPRLANRLDAIMKGAVLTNPKNKIENKIQEKNPVNKIPKVPKLPY